MNSRPAGAPTRPRWLVAVLIVLLLIPAATANVALIAAVTAVAGLSLLRAVRGRRARAAAVAGAGDAVALGCDGAGEPVLLSDRQLSAHGLILGASGAGKSTTLLAILTAHVLRARPVVAIDMKGSPAFARELAAAAAAAGRPFRMWTPDGPGHWNPLQHGNATELKDKLIATERFTEPHYQRAAERYVQTVLQVLHEVHPERPATLEEVVGLMDPRRMAVMLRALPGSRAARVQDYVTGLTHDQLSAVRGLGTRLAIISESHVGPRLCPAGEGDIDLRAALAGREVVLFSLNSSQYGKLAAQIGTLVIQDLVTAVGHRLAHGDDVSETGAAAPAAGAPATAAPAGAAREQATIGIDEFSALGADNVVSLLARGREARVSVLLATQELADLDRAAPGLRDQVLGNTAIKIAHRQDVPGSAQTIALIAGTKLVWEQTYQLGRGALGGHDTGRGTRREVEQFVVHPNEIKALQTGQAILITKLPSTRTRTVRVTPPHRRPGPATPPHRRDGPELG
jgi:conjugal transfer pilus assembly protein TraD